MPTSIETSLAIYYKKAILQSTMIFLIVSETIELHNDHITVSMDLIQNYTTYFAISSFSSSYFHIYNFTVHSFVCLAIASWISW